MHQWGKDSMLNKTILIPYIVTLNRCFQNNFCGPFLISKGFWIDAGQCVLENDNPSDPEGSRYCDLMAIFASWKTKSCVLCPAFGCG